MTTVRPATGSTPSTRAPAHMYGLHWPTGAECMPAPPVGCVLAPPLASHTNGAHVMRWQMVSPPVGGGVAVPPRYFTSTAAVASSHPHVGVPCGPFAPRFVPPRARPCQPHQRHGGLGATPTPRGQAPHPHMLSHAPGYGAYGFGGSLLVPMRVFHGASPHHPHPSLLARHVGASNTAGPQVHVMRDHDARTWCRRGGRACVLCWRDAHDMCALPWYRIGQRLCTQIHVPTRKPRVPTALPLHWSPRRWQSHVASQRKPCLKLPLRHQQRTHTLPCRHQPQRQWRPQRQPPRPRCPRCLIRRHTTPGLP